MTNTAAEEPSSRLARLGRSLVGPPLRSSEAAKEEIGPIQGLPALSLDALTSVAYGPEAIVVVLAAAGASALKFTLPIEGVIVGLLVLLVISYRQVIEGYPQGGGAYAVSRANLGKGLSQLAAASLIVDYTLTVAVSVAAGVAALTSAFTSLVPLTVPLDLGFLGLITVLNLRGLGESAKAFFIPTALFIFGLLAVIAIGLVHPLAPHLRQPGHSLVPTSSLAPLGILLLLKAFSAGCSALTGVEAIANGVPLFRQPRVKRAKQTEMLLGAILAVMLLGLAILVIRFHIGPRSNQTVLSQVMAASVGRSFFYYLVSLSVTATLALAANTSFGGLPILASLLARDNYLPHGFAIRGDRLVFTKGIWVLAAMSAALLIAVGGSTNALIPLFAIGVFIGFTLAQGGMVLHWRKLRPNHWHRRALLNGLGAVMTAAATLIFLISKFTAGAWVVVVAIPLFILLFHRVQAYYERVGAEMALGEVPPPPMPRKILVVVPVNGVSAITSEVLSDALSLGHEVVAVTVEFADEEEVTRKLESQWRRWSPGVRLVTLHSQYHSVARPILRFLKFAGTSEEYRDHRIVVLIPVVDPTRWRYRILHNQIDLVLTAALRRHCDAMVLRRPVRPHSKAPGTTSPATNPRGEPLEGGVGRTS